MTQLRLAEMALTDRQQYMKEDVCWAAFRVFDRNGDGHISTQELKQAGTLLYSGGRVIDLYPEWPKFQQTQVLQSSEVEDALGIKAIADLMVEVDSNLDDEGYKSRQRFKEPFDCSEL